VFTANLDALGSMIWKQCDGTKTVKQILEMITKEFPDEKDIDQRLFLFLQQLNALNYITF
jgi:Coenzyme PQQ synthesis protein D (PqqD)